MIFKDSAIVAFVDDDDALRAANAQSLELAGFKVLALSTAQDALNEIRADFEGVVITDVRMPQMDGNQLFRRLRDLDPDLPVILITGHANVSEAVEAIQEGAYDYLAKPYGADRLVASARRALEKRRLVLDNRRLRAAVAETETDGALVGETKAMEQLRSTIRQIAGTDIDVVLEGETGTGKELVARCIHRLSHRRARPLSTIDFAALPDVMVESELFGHEAGAFAGALRRRVGRIEAADRGTLFLDEIESMPASVQGKLLRVLEEREITPLGGNEVRGLDVRVITAVKGDLARLVESGAFRGDLFHRLDAVRLRIPPLRERRADIPLLFAHFLAKAAARFRREPPPLTDAVRRRLLEHAWPGNARELNHFAERVVLRVGELGLEETDAGSEGLHDRVEAFEAQIIRDTLVRCSGDVRIAIQTLSLPRKTFYDKLRRHAIDIDQYRHGR
ncbi:MAG: Fis family transcriptional regulator [Caulobacteraceae bacterium]|nr:Fis family transcriptional regulator [Caulobacteraceae bacterium]